MKAEEFLDILRSAMPSTEELRNYGLDPDETRQIQSIFLPAPKIEAGEAPLITGEIGRLVSSYDCKDLQVSDVCFDKVITVKPFGFKFGKCEADPLVVSNDGTVLMFDHAVESASPIICAASPANFLNALAILIQTTAEKSKWKGRGAHVTEQCHSAAGHASSLAFYASRCDFLDR